MLSLPDPMLPSAGPLPDGEGWAYQLKWDGIRAVARTNGSAMVRSRRGRALTERFPEVVAALSTLPARTLVDGELVICDPDGRPDFGAVRRRLGLRDPYCIANEAAARPAALVVFDLLAGRGEDLTGKSWQQRHDRLRLFAERSFDGQQLCLAPTTDDGAALWEATRQMSLEGLVAKRTGSSYRPGHRTRDWVKTKHTIDTCHVVVGVSSRPACSAFVLASAAEDGSFEWSTTVEWCAPQVRQKLLLRLRQIDSGALGWRHSNVTWVAPEITVRVRSLLHELREARIVAVCDAP